MIGLLKFILLGLICVFATAGVATPDALADQPADVRSHGHFYGDDQVSVLRIAPELTNPAEIPLVETQPEAMPSLTLFREGFIIPKSDKSAEPEGVFEEMDIPLEQWLASVKNVFEGN